MESDKLIVNSGGGNITHFLQRCDCLISILNVKEYKTSIINFDPSSKIPVFLFKFFTMKELNIKY